MKFSQFISLWVLTITVSVSFGRSQQQSQAKEFQSTLSYLDKSFMQICMPQKKLDKSMLRQFKTGIKKLAAKNMAVHSVSVVDVKRGRTVFFVNGTGPEPRDKKLSPHILDLSRQAVAKGTPQYTNSTLDGNTPGLLWIYPFNKVRNEYRNVLIGNLNLHNILDELKDQNTRPFAVATEKETLYKTHPILPLKPVSSHVFSTYGLGDAKMLEYANMRPLWRQPLVLGLDLLDIIKSLQIPAIILFVIIAGFKIVKHFEKVNDDKFKRLQERIDKETFNKWHAGEQSVQDTTGWYIPQNMIQPTPKPTQYQVLKQRDVPQQTSSHFVQYQVLPQKKPQHTPQAAGIPAPPARSFHRDTENPGFLRERPDADDHAAPETYTTHLRRKKPGRL